MAYGSDVIRDGARDRSMVVIEGWDEIRAVPANVRSWRTFVRMAFVAGLFRGWVLVRRTISRYALFGQALAHKVRPMPP